jgi:hypothetical protein
MILYPSMTWRVDTLSKLFMLQARWMCPNMLDVHMLIKEAQISEGKRCGSRQNMCTELKVWHMLACCTIYKWTGRQTQGVQTIITKCQNIPKQRILGQRLAYSCKRGTKRLEPCQWLRRIMRTIGADSPRHAS